MASTIEYTVSLRPQDPARLNTEQVLTLGVIEKEELTLNRTGSVRFSMDYLTYAGTFIASFETYMISVVFPIEELDFYEEMLFSAMDFQRLAITPDLTFCDMPSLRGIPRDLVLTPNTHSFELLPSATHVRLRFSGQLIPLPE